MSQVPGPSNDDAYNLRARPSNRDEQFWRPQFRISSPSEVQTTLEQDDIHETVDQLLSLDAPVSYAAASLLSAAAPSSVADSSSSTSTFSAPELSSNNVQHLVSSQDIPLNICPYCNKKCKSGRGVKIHIGLSHKNNSHQTTFSQSIADHIEQEDNAPNPDIDFMQIISTLKRKVRVLKHVPKAARNFAATKLSGLIDNCVRNNNQESWQNLFLFSFNGLRVPTKEKSKSLTSIVKRNLSSQIVKNVDVEISHAKKPLSLSKRIEAKLSEFDVRGAIRLLKSDDILAPVNLATLNELENKHPCPSRPLSFPDLPPDLNHIVVTLENVRKGIFSFPKGSAAGMDGLSPQILKDLISKSAGQGGVLLLQSITNLCNLMFRGQIIESFCPFLYGANLCALQKKDGGIRPIAVGCIFRRLTAKIGCSYVRDEISTYFQPQQLGFATRQGGESIVHAVRSFVNANQTSDFILFKVDFKNAFNTAERDVILEEVKIRIPCMLPFLQQCYQSHSNLLYGENVIKSEVGAQQGDPAGPLLFSLALHPIVKKLKSNLNVWYLDDGIIGGDPNIVLEDLALLRKESKKIGLELNFSKCELYFCCGMKDEEMVTSFQRILPGVKVVENTELCILGSPICEQGYESHFNERFVKTEFMLERIKSLSTHVAYFLLKTCTTIPKMTYSTRTTPMWMYPECLERIDSIMKTTMEKIFNSQLTPIQWTQSTLPVRVGGLGIRKIFDISLPAFISSGNGVKPLVSLILNKAEDNFHIPHLNDAMTLWDSKYNRIATNITSQKEWDDIIVNHILQNEMIFTDNEDIARFKALQCKESGAWLQVVPAKQIGTLIENRTFRICVGLRLGCTICRPHPCICGTDSVDSKGIHPLSCAKSSGRFTRHSSINNVLKRALVSVDVPCQLEPTGLTANTNIRPDGISIVPWSNGKHILWDVTCTDTLAPSNLSRTVQEQGAAAEMACKNKRRKYQELCEDYKFVGFAVETMGTMCEEARDLVEEIGRRLIEKTGSSAAATYFIQRISIEIQRGNAASVIGACPISEDLEEMYYV